MRHSMPVTIGTKIGPYEVKSRLGEGGMGVVFRARDSKLQRDVHPALIVLHKSAFADPVPDGTDADARWAELRDTRHFSQFRSDALIEHLVAGFSPRSCRHNVYMSAALNAG
jgi:serine/threonine protein kinase